MLTQMKQQTHDISCLRKREEKFEAEAKEQEIGQLREEVNDIDQYSRRLSMEVHGYISKRMKIFSKR